MISAARFIIRPERQPDYKQISRLLDAAFGGTYESAPSV